jgi:Spy/CpxP family protein refolding chaperone
MRFSPALVIGILTIAAVTALAVPLVLHPQFIAQQSSPSEALDPSTHGDNAAPRGNRRRGEILQRLNLTQDQFKQLSVVRAQYQPLIRDRALTTRTTQAELRQLLSSAAPESEVKAKYQQLQQQRQDLQQIRFESVLAMRQILTLEQRQAFEAGLGRRRSSRRDRP